MKNTETIRCGILMYVCTQMSDIDIVVGPFHLRYTLPVDEIFVEGSGFWRGGGVGR